MGGKKIAPLSFHPNRILSGDSRHSTKIRQEAIEIAILRSVMGYHWKKGCETGPKKYLCKADTNKLSKLILEKSETTDQLDAGDVIESAYRIKLDRLKRALQFLKSTNSPAWSIFHSKKNF